MFTVSQNLYITFIDGHFILAYSKGVFGACPCFFEKRQVLKPARNTGACVCKTLLDERKQKRYT